MAQISVEVDAIAIYALILKKCNNERETHLTTANHGEKKSLCEWVENSLYK